MSWRARWLSQCDVCLVHAPRSKELAVLDALEPGWKQYFRRGWGMIAFHVCPECAVPPDGMLQPVLQKEKGEVAK